MDIRFLVVFLLSILIIGTVSASIENLGTFKQNSCVGLKQSCANCTFVNLTSVISPNGQKANNGAAMTKNGVEYNYTFCSTDQLGTYIYNTLQDPDGVATVAPVTFEVTPSGFADTLGFYFILLAAIVAVITLGFVIKDGWFVVIGGMGLIIVGVYSINSGIAGFRDMFLTWAIALFEMGVGAYLSINSAIELIGEE